MKRKGISILLALALAVSLVPAIRVTAEATEQLRTPAAYWAGTSIKWDEVEHAKGYRFTLWQDIPGYGTQAAGGCYLERNGNTVSIDTQNGTMWPKSCTYSSASGYTLDVSNCVTHADVLYWFSLDATASDYANSEQIPGEMVRGEKLMSGYTSPIPDTWKREDITAPIYLTYQEPVVGQKPNLSVTVGSGQCQLSSSSVMPDTGVPFYYFINKVQRMFGSDTFQSGNSYRASIWLDTTTAGAVKYHFPSDVKVYCNGKAADVVWNDGDTLQCQYTYDLDSKEYAVSVVGGTADRNTAPQYQQVFITAAQAPAGKVFDRWDVVSGSAVLYDRYSADTYFHMPANDLTLKAVYKNAPTHIVTSASVNVREGPGTEYGRVGGLVKDQTVEVITTQGEWSRIAYGTDYGWVMSSLLAPIGGKELENPFVDVSKSDPYYSAVLWAYYASPQVTNGINATHFGPMNTVTRAQCATFLWRAMGEPEPTSKSNPFVDVSPSQYYYKPILWAVENGITKGTNATHFSPNNTLSTAHMITFLYRAKNPGMDGWYAEAANWAGNGYGGKPFGVNTAVDNNTPCPRGYAVMFLQQAK